MARREGPAPLAIIATRAVVATIQQSFDAQRRTHGHKDRDRGYSALPELRNSIQRPHRNAAEFSVISPFGEIPWTRAKLNRRVIKVMACSIHHEASK